MNWRIWVTIAFATVFLVATPAYALVQTRDLEWSYAITTASTFPGDEPADDPAGELVWVCKLVGPPGKPQLQSGQNPIQVAADATSNGTFNDAHGSPVVPAGTDRDDAWSPAAHGADPGEKGIEGTENKYHSELVWICKLVGPAGNPQLQSGENPMQVPANATSAGKFHDAHGSPVVAPGTDCDGILPPVGNSEVETREGESIETEQDAAGERDDAYDDEDQNRSEADIEIETEEMGQRENEREPVSNIVVS